MSSLVQSISFHKDNWTISKAQIWLNDRGLKPKSVKKTENYIRFVMRPKKSKKSKIIKLKNSINLTIG